MKVLVTGDKGFVGTATTKLLHRRGHTLIGYDLMDGFDIRDVAQLEERVKLDRPERILHLAAIARFSDADRDPQLAHETNVLGTINVARVARRHHIPIVYSSTGSVYMPVMRTPPITEEFPACGNSVYGCTKYLGECYIRQATPYIILRYAHLYGAEKRMHGLIGGFLDRIKRGLAPVLMGGRQSNDFCYIEDIAEANVLALETPWDKWNQVYNIGTGQELTAELAGEMICSAFGYKGQIEYKERRTVDPERFVFDCTKAETMLRFRSKYTFLDGLAHMQSVMGDDETKRFLQAVK
jgi:nucleoside-diphosphate-sugar epimerase